MFDPHTGAFVERAPEPPGVPFVLDAWATAVLDPNTLVAIVDLADPLTPERPEKVAARVYRMNQRDEAHLWLTLGLFDRGVRAPKGADVPAPVIRTLAGMLLATRGGRSPGRTIKWQREREQLSDAIADSIGRFQERPRGRWARRESRKRALVEHIGRHLESRERRRLSFAREVAANVRCYVAFFVKRTSLERDFFLNATGLIESSLSWWWKELVEKPTERILADVEAWNASLSRGLRLALADAERWGFLHQEFDRIRSGRFTKAESDLAARVPTDIGVLVFRAPQSSPALLSRSLSH